MKILKKSDTQFLTEEEENLRRFVVSSPMARSLQEHLEKWYPNKGLLEEGSFTNATADFKI